MTPTDWPHRREYRRRHIVRSIVIGLGIICGFGFTLGVVGAVLIIVAQDSGAGHQLRHRIAAYKLWRSK